MKPEIADALCEWLAGLAVGLAPLVAHLIVLLGMTPSGHVEGSWAVDWCFLAIATSATSIVSVVTRYRRGAMHVVRGRAAPALIAANTLFLVAAAVLYAIVASGNGAGGAVFLGAGLFIGAAIVSLYLELSVAASAAGAT